MNLSPVVEEIDNLTRPDHDVRTLIRYTATQLPVITLIMN